MLLVDKELGVSKELRASIEQFFGEYGQAFSCLSAEAVVPFFAMPFYVEIGDESFVWAASEKPGLIHVTDGLLGYYRGLGVQKVEPRVELIMLTGRNRASVVMSWMLCDDHGTQWVLDKSYQLLRDGDSWKIWACCGNEAKSL